jgi:argininosuccinate lyase
VLESLPLEKYKEYSELFEQDLYEDIDLFTCVNKRNSVGGTSVKSIEKQIKFVREQL